MPSFPMPLSQDAARLSSHPAHLLAPVAAVLVETSFRGVMIGACVLTSPRVGSTRRWRARAPRRDRFVIGNTPAAQAPTPLRDQRPAHTLVALGEQGARIALAAGMRAELLDEHGQSTQVHHPGGQEDVALAFREAATIACGDTVFHLSATERPVVLPRPRWTFSLAETWYAAAAVALLLTALGVGMFIPSDPHALSFDLPEIYQPVQIALRIPALLPEARAEAIGHAPMARSESVERRPQGKPTRSIGAGRTHGSLPASSAGDPRKAGLLALLETRTDPAVTALLGRHSALGEASERVLAELGAGGDGFDTGGLGVSGTGTGHTGTQERLLGTGILGTMGGCAREPCGTGAVANRARAAGQLATRSPRGLDIQIDGHPSVRGQLDKEIVRRVIRRHLNEVRFCYEKELGRRADLGGRMVVEFTIAPQGQVLAAVIAVGLGHVALDACVAAAVRRWEFPAPKGGGLVVVRYPFVFTPAGT